jgi:hypothetical protein
VTTPEVQREVGHFTMHKLTYFLVALVLSTLAFSLVRNGPRSAAFFVAGQTNDKADRFQDDKHHFPTAEYTEPDLVDPEKNLARKEKQKRYNNFKLVSIKPQPWKVETLITSDSLFAFPALPVAQSELIFTGSVGSARAHLSENKKNVFTEFTVTVEAVHKATNQQPTQGSVLTIDRIGGFVRYPNGQEVLYRFSGANMPKIGARYLFFINSKNKQDYNILTAYELIEGRVIPLDVSSQFASLDGISEEEILKKLRLLLNPSN